MNLKKLFYSACENGNLEVTKNIYPHIKVDNNKLYIYFLVACLKKNYHIAEWLYEVRDKDDEDFVDDWFLDNVIN